jgi:hypothetical protein
VFTGPLPISGRPSVACVRFAGMCLPSRLPSNGYTRHSIQFLAYDVNQNGHPRDPVEHTGLLFRKVVCDSSVGVATGHGLDDRGVRLRGPVGARIFSMSSRPVLWPTQPPIQWVPGALSLGLKRPEREDDHPPTSAEIKKTWIYTSTSPYAFMA